MKLFNRCLEFLAEEEGIDSNHPQDQGGRTRYGISQAAFPDIDVAQLKWKDARRLYWTHYWQPLPMTNWDIPNDLAFALFDSAVQHMPPGGPPQWPVTFIQRALHGLMQDGVYGPVTHAAVQRHADRVTRDMLAERALYYHRIILNRPDQSVFQRGWFRRITHAAQFAHAIGGAFP